MLRKAEARSCSLTVSSPVALNSICAGDVAPQYGQMSACLAGFHCASPPQAGQESFFLAVASGIVRVHRFFKNSIPTKTAFARRDHNLRTQTNECFPGMRTIYTDHLNLFFGPASNAVE